MILAQWAIKWGVPLAALKDLEHHLGLEGLGAIPATLKGDSEAAAQAAVRLEAAQKGVRLFRNNVGALKDERGVPVRYGLANESAEINKVLKSADLIGWRPVLIGPEHLGRRIAQFVSREVKAPGWTYGGTDREQAQWRWAQLVAAAGGDSGFCTGAGTL